MFNESSGQMYEQYENTEYEKKKKKKAIKKRLTTVAILLLLVIYFVILLIDLNRYKNGQDPLILLGTTIKEYDDGTVTTKTSIGWVFRDYNRETIKKSEMVPIWSPIKMDNELNRTNEGNYPEIETGYDVPSNTLYEEKVNGVLFFYDSENNLLDTYKCIESEDDCEITISDTYDDIDNSLIEYKMSIEDNRYVFITEYKNKNTEAQSKKVYLYDINAKKIIAEYEGIHYTKLVTTKDEETYKETTKGLILDSTEYIAKKNNKYGIEKVEKGKIIHVVDYQYDEIYYLEETKDYIVKKDDKYYLLNKEDNTISNECPYLITNVYRINDTIYTLAKQTEEYTNNIIYHVYNKENTEIINGTNYTNLKIYEKFMTYVNDNKLYFISYSGEKLIKEDIPVYFDDTYGLLKAYIIEIKNNELKISTPHTREYTRITDEYYYNMDTWELTKTRKNIKETVD